MRSIRRPTVRLPTFTPTGTGGSEGNRRRTVWEQTHNAEEVNKNFPPHWNRADVRGALYAMQGRACAYCQRNLPGSDRGDVEHFRPKNLYWWLAYKFDNLLLSCTVCNSALKINKFPMLPRSRSYGYAKRHRIDRENRALIDPAVDPVDGWMTVSFDMESIRREGMKIEINPKLRRKERARCKQTIEFFRLNTDSELLRERLMFTMTVLKTFRLARQGDAESIQDLKRASSRYHEHSFLVRELISQNNRREFLATREEEIEWLIDEFVGLLRSALRALGVRPGDARERNMRDRCAYGLAVLMIDPPALSEAAIRNRIPADVRPTVEQRLKELR